MNTYIFNFIYEQNDLPITRVGKEKIKAESLEKALKELKAKYKKCRSIHSTVEPKELNLKLF